MDVAMRNFRATGREGWAMTMQGISERAMRELAGVNAAFISVVTMDDAERRGGFGLADEIISRLRLLDDESRRRMAYRPFALFTLNFRDSAGWKQLVEQQLLNEQFCKVEYYVAEEVRGEGADQEIKAKVHCTDGRDFEIERKGEAMKFRFEQCGKVYC